MEKARHNLFAILMALVMAAALFSAFSITLFHQTPEVILPSLAPAPVGSAPAQQGGDFQPVIVDETTVQQVVASLERPQSYSRSITTETLGADGLFGASSATVTVDGGWTRVVSVLPDRRIAYTLVGDGKRYVWYGTDTAYQTFDAQERSADLAQRLPTYEDVLDADPEHIIAAGYEESGGLPCIYVAVEVPELGYVESYWVSVDTGLLVHAESSRDDQVFYRMSGYTVETPAAPNQIFALPDGTALHRTTPPG